ncbi:hypothetical protein OG713_12465 [Streptomyces sp. NBC_00723]|uniref:hypothetical protein n=1 Tax=Streptomyces sp. NBC_00723 TaxID=2903673 RepID=UPI0038693512
MPLAKELLEAERELAEAMAALDLAEARNDADAKRAAREAVTRAQHEIDRQTEPSLTSSSG